MIWSIVGKVLNLLQPKMDEFACISCKMVSKYYKLIISGRPHYLSICCDQ